MKKHTITRWIPVLAAAAFCSIGAVDALAQAAAEAAATADAPPATLWESFLIGGTFMWPILALNVALVGLAVYNGMAMAKKKWVPDELKAPLLEHMSACRVRSAIELASTSPSFFGRMMAYSLPKIDATQPEGLGRDAVEDAMAEFITNETREPVMYINYLTTIMQAAPMLGLLGTVSGMVSAFAMLAQSKGADPGKLANSISEALYTTYFGLVVAIPALICYAIYKNIFNARVASVMESGKELIEASVNAVQGEQLFSKVPEGLHAE